MSWNRILFSKHILHYTVHRIFSCLELYKLFDILLFVEVESLIITCLRTSKVFTTKSSWWKLEWFVLTIVLVDSVGWWRWTLLTVWYHPPTILSILTSLHQSGLNCTSAQTHTRHLNNQNLKIFHQENILWRRTFSIRVQQQFINNKMMLLLDL